MEIGLVVVEKQAFLVLNFPTRKRVEMSQEYDVSASIPLFLVAQHCMFKLYCIVYRHAL